MESDEDRVIHLIRQRGCDGATRRDVQDAMNWSKGAALGVLRKFVKAGRLERRWSGSPERGCSVWYLPEHAPAQTDADRTHWFGTTEPSDPSG